MYSTTHFMDEAYLLGDRIAIMADGELQCCGSSLFLKSKFGAGYNLTFVRKPEIPEDALIKTVNEHVSTGKLLSNMGNEVIFQLPFEANRSFAAMLKELEMKKTELGIATYGIGVTTMEDVFLKVSAKNHQLEGDADAPIDLPTSPHTKQNTAVTKTGGNSHILRHLGALYLKRFHYGRRDGRAICCSLVAPVIMFLLGILLLNFTAIKTNSPQLSISKAMFLGDTLPTPYTCSASPDAATCNYLFSEMPSDISLKPIDLNVIGTNVKLFDTTYANTSLYVSPPGSVLQMMKGTLDAAPADTPYQFGSVEVIADGFAARKQTTAIIGVNSSCVLGASFYSNAVHNSIYQLVTGSQQNRISVSSFPLPLTHYSGGSTEISGLVVALFLTIAMAFIPATVIYYVVRERDNIHNAKHLQLVSGASFTAYWCANLLWDITLYLATFIAAGEILQAFKVTPFIGCSDPLCVPDTFLATAALLAVYGISVIPMAYLFSFIFKQPGMAQSMQLFLSLVVGLAGMMATMIMDLIPNTKDTSTNLKWFLRLFPQYALGNGLLNIKDIDYVGLKVPTPGVAMAKSAFDKDVTGKNLVYMFCSCIVYTVLAIAIDFLLVKFAANSLTSSLGLKQSQAILPSAPEDDDVMAESHRVANTNGSDELLRVRNLRKQYSSGKTAVHNLSFGLSAGTCFGFLGVNGGNLPFAYLYIALYTLPHIHSIVYALHSNS